VTYNGKTSLLIEVRKEANANAVVVGDEVANIIAKELKIKKLSYEILINQATEIQRAINEVKDAAISGGGLTAVMIYFLLQSFSATIIVLTSIPLSILICMVGMLLTGMSFNTMSLIGMALGIGMIVDSAIVVLDSISYYRARLDDPKEAALWGAKKVFGQVIISTLCTMTVFAPLVFAPGMIGGIFKDVSLVVIYSLAASIVIGLMIIPPLSVAMENIGFNMPSAKTPEWPKYPMGKLAQFFWVWRVQLYRIHKTLILLKVKIRFFLASYVLVPVKYLAKTWLDKMPLLLALFEKTMFILEGKYEQLIFQKIKGLKRFLIVSGISLGASLVLFLNLGSEFFPEEKSGSLSARLSFPSSMPRSEAESVLVKLENKILQSGMGKLATIYQGSGENKAQLFLTSINEDYQVASFKLQKMLLDVPELIFTIDKKSLVSQARPIQVEIYSDDLDMLEQQTMEILSALKKNPDIKNPSSDIKQKVPELRMVFNRVKLSRSETEINDYVAPLKTMLNDSNAGSMEVSGEAIPISISKQNEQFQNQAAINYFAVWNKNKVNYLQDVSDIKLTQALPLIRHNEKKRMMLVEADLNGVDLATGAKSIERQLAKNPKMKNINWQIGGAESERTEVQKKMVGLVLISLLLIYVLMASQFENLIQPLLIMIAIPLCLIGSAVMLWGFGINVSAIVFVGIIILAGSCVSTSIILVDSINQNLSNGMEIMEAILVAAKNRMRAVFLTAGTNIVGLFPLLFSTQEGAALQKTLAVTIIGGMTSSTVLTMLMIPAIFYHLQNRKKEASRVSATI
jgi:HAE1 family hydrophobic/amphiphilic exporter-1